MFLYDELKFTREGMMRSKDGIEDWETYINEKKPLYNSGDITNDTAINLETYEVYDDLCERLQDIDIFIGKNI